MQGAWAKQEVKNKREENNLSLHTLEQALVYDVPNEEDEELVDMVLSLDAQVSIDKKGDQMKPLPVPNFLTSMPSIFQLPELAKASA